MNPPTYYELNKDKLLKYQKEYQQNKSLSMKRAYNNRYYHNVKKHKTKKQIDYNYIIEYQVEINI